MALGTPVGVAILGMGFGGLCLLVFTFWLMPNPFCTDALGLLNKAAFSAESTHSQCMM